MKRTIFSIAAVCLMASLASASVLYETDFITGYTNATSVNGQDGWAEFGTGNTYVVTTLPLMIVQPTGGYYKEAYQTVDTGSNTTVTFKSSMQISSINENATGTAFLASGDTTGPKVNMSMAGGFQYFNNGVATTLIANITGDAQYAFEMTIDMASHTYDLSVTDPSSQVTTATDIGFNGALTSFNKLALGGFQSTAGNQSASAFKYVELSAVPEPATMALLGMGAVAALIRRKRKK